jgi:hypothetical protein
MRQTRRGINPTGLPEVDRPQHCQASANDRWVRRHPKASKACLRSCRPSSTFSVSSIRSIGMEERSSPASICTLFAGRCRTVHSPRHWTGACCGMLAKRSRQRIHIRSNRGNKSRLTAHLQGTWVQETSRTFICRISIRRFGRVRFDSRPRRTYNNGSTPRQ